jgi:hypothetical protein
MAQASTGFRDLLDAMMRRRWFITAIVLGGFMVIILGIFVAIMNQNPMSTEWKELLLLLLGAFIGSYGKIIDYWFSDTDKDKMLVQKMDEEDGTSLSNTADGPNNPIIPTDISPLVLPTNSDRDDDSSEELPTNLRLGSDQATDQVEVIKSEPRIGIEVDEDGDGTMDGIDFDGDGKIDVYFEHRQCEHVWGDEDGDGEEECLKCGKIKEVYPL